MMSRTARSKAPLASSGSSSHRIGLRCDDAALAVALPRRHLAASQHVAAQGVHRGEHLAAQLAEPGEVGLVRVELEDHRRVLARLQAVRTRRPRRPPAGGPSRGLRSRRPGPAWRTPSRPARRPGRRSARRARPTRRSPGRPPSPPAGATGGCRRGAGRGSRSPPRPAVRGGPRGTAGSSRPARASGRPGSTATAGPRARTSRGSRRGRARSGSRPTTGVRKAKFAIALTSARL